VDGCEWLWITAKALEQGPADRSRGRPRARPAPVLCCPRLGPRPSHFLPLTSHLPQHAHHAKSDHIEHLEHLAHLAGPHLPPHLDRCQLPSSAVLASARAPLISYLSLLTSPYMLITRKVINLSALSILSNFPRAHPPIPFGAAPRPPGPRTSSPPSAPGPPDPAHPTRPTGPSAPLSRPLPLAPRPPRSLPSCSPHTRPAARSQTRRRAILTLLTRRVIIRP
jgi:hypothetical protein